MSAINTPSISFLLNNTTFGSNSLSNMTNTAYTGTLSQTMQMVSILTLVLQILQQINTNQALMKATTGNGHTVNAGTGDDLINAGAGNDTISGGEGNDVLIAKEGDTITLDGVKYMVRNGALLAT